jgi:hypothetical protein
VLFVALDQMYHLRPFAAPSQKYKLVEIFQNYLAIFTKNSRYLTSNACNFLKNNLTPVLKRILWHLTRRIICAYFQDLFAKTKDFIAQNLRSAEHGAFSVLEAECFIKSVSTSRNTCLFKLSVQIVLNLYAYVL